MELDALRARAPTKRHKARAGGTWSMESRWIGVGGRAWWRAQCAASRVGDKDDDGRCRAKVFCSIRCVREEEEREIIWHWRSVAQHEVVRASWGWKSGSTKVLGGGSWATPRYMVKSMSVHVCLGTGCHVSTVYPGPATPKSALPCPALRYHIHPNHLTTPSNTCSICHHYHEALPLPLFPLSPSHHQWPSHFSTLSPLTVGAGP